MSYARKLSYLWCASEAPLFFKDGVAISQTVTLTNIVAKMNNDVLTHLLSLEENDRLNNFSLSVRHCYSSFKLLEGTYDKKQPLLQRCSSSSTCGLLVNTLSLMTPRKEKSIGVRSGDRGGHSNWGWVLRVIGNKRCRRSSTLTTQCCPNQNYGLT